MKFIDNLRSIYNRAVEIGKKKNLVVYIIYLMKCRQSTMYNFLPIIGINYFRNLITYNLNITAIDYAILVVTRLLTS